MSDCATCKFYNGNQNSGHCMNILNAEKRNVGGGGEYSSSADCFTMPRVDPLQGCDLHEAGKYQYPSIRPVPEEIRRARWEEEQRRWNGQTTQTAWPGSPYGSYLGKLNGLL